MKRILIIHIVLLIALALPAQSVKELQKQQRELQQQLEQTSKMLKQTKKDETATVNKLNLLNNDIQIAIQTEIMNNVKSKLNSNPEIISKVKRLKNIIKDVKEQQDNENRKSMNELNDYIKNYSDMTFNEYKQLKNSK
jgi:septal ring factor EnvC (AmiA/AmiB activator)